MLHQIRRRVRWTWHYFYPWTGLRGLDRKVVSIIGDSRHGFFVEAGANDGIRQSNTYYLSRRRAWRGLLVEPVPSLAADCRRNRPESTVKNCALVASEIDGAFVDVVDVDLMSVVHESTDEQEAVLRVAEDVQRIRRSIVSIIGRSLSSLLEEIGNPAVDFLSLDVEGYETEVLKGLDLQKHSPKWILVETRKIDSVREILQPTHDLHSQLTIHDYLFCRRA